MYRIENEETQHHQNSVLPDPLAGGSDNSGNLSRRGFLTRAALSGVGLIAATSVPLLVTEQQALAWGLFSAPSPDQQKQVGRQAAQQILQKYREVRDSRSRAFQDMGERLVHALSPQDQRTWDYNFHVIESKEVNAFALPGGPMFMYTGLYDHLDTMDALAAVTGHEMTHVRKQHWAKAYAKQQQRDLAIGIGLAIFHAGRAAQTIAQLADSAIGLKFSRGEETEADRGGFDNMMAAGYNPGGMIQLFQELEKLSGNGTSLGGDFLSDHPATSARINNVKQWIMQKGDPPSRPLTPIVRA